MFRALGKSKIAFVLAILFGISLFFFRKAGTYSNFLNSDNVIAKVSGTPISTTKFNRTLEMNIQQFNQMLGKSLSGEEIKKFQIHQLALGALINEAVFENEYDKLKFKLDETLIAKWTKKSIPQLYNKKNKLDERNLKDFLQQQNLKIEDIVQIIHYEVRNQFFNEAFLEVEYPKLFSSKIEKYDTHKRQIEYIKFPIELVDISSLIKSNEYQLDEILNSYYQNNINTYMSEEKRSVEYVLINKENIQDKFTPSFDEITEYYNNNSNLYIEEEKRSFIQFNFKTFDEAKKIKSKIEYINNYNEILIFANDNNTQYNIFQNLSEDDVFDEIAEPLFQLGINGQSTIIKSTLAHHIIVLKDINQSRKLTLNEVEKDIRSTITEIDTNNYLVDLENNISQDILNGMDLNALADTYNLKVSGFNNISKNYDNFDEKDNIFYENLINNTFNANADFVNDIVRIDKNNFYLYKVTNILVSKPIKFKEIRDNVFKDWKVSKKIEEIHILLDKNKTNFNFINQLASKYNTTIKEISINNTNNDLPRILISDIFSNDLNTFSVATFDNKIYITRTLDIKMLKNTNSNSNKILLYKDFRNSLNSELLKKVKISTNDKLINVLLNRY